MCMHACMMLLSFTTMSRWSTDRQSWPGQDVPVTWMCVYCSLFPSVLLPPSAYLVFLCMMLPGRCSVAAHLYIFLVQYNPACPTTLCPTAIICAAPTAEPWLLYCIAGKFDGEFNLADLWMTRCTVKLKSVKCLVCKCVCVCACADQRMDFFWLNSLQFFQLYSKCIRVTACHSVITVAHIRISQHIL